QRLRDPACLTEREPQPEALCERDRIPRAEQDISPVVELTTKRNEGRLRAVPHLLVGHERTPVGEGPADGRAGQRRECPFEQPQIGAEHLLAARPEQKLPAARMRW